MSAFKVGQRVRLVGYLRGKSFRLVPLRTTGTLLRATPLSICEWSVDWDGYPPPPRAEWGVDSCQIVPLSDPKAEEFIERIKKLKPLESCTLTPSDLERVRGGA